LSSHDIGLALLQVEANPMKRWNFGIVGAGLIADFHARAIADIPNASLTAVCDPNSDKANGLAKKFSCKAFDSHKEMLEGGEVDVLTIATPSGFHMEPTVDGARAGKHVICEKPLEITLPRLDAMIEAHKDAGTKLGCIFQSRFNDALTPLRDAIRQGRLGTITHVGIYVPWWRANEYYKDSWHGTWKLDGGGALMNQAIHIVDTLCEFAPLVQFVQASTSSIGHDGLVETEDTTVATLQFANGALGSIYATTASWPGLPRRFEITGTQGTIIYQDDSYTCFQFAKELPQDKAVLEKYGKTKHASGPSDPAAFTPAMHTECFKAFINSIESGCEFIINGREARKSVELILAVYESARTGKKVAVNQ